MSSEPIVPVIDLAPFRRGDQQQKQALAQTIDQACSQIGFIVITGHGVSDEIMAAAWASTQGYFDLPVAQKRAIPMSGAYPYGYSGFAEETLAQSRDQEAAPDLKESFCIGPYQTPSTVPATIWPDKPPAFKKAWLAYYQAMEKLAATLLQAFALGLGLDENWFADKIDRHISALRALNYPVLAEQPQKRQLRASAHSDYGSLTILKSGGPGLQVQSREGTWIDVPFIDNAFIVNLGDLMAYWTNDRWVSTLHRVLAPQLETQQRRQSLAFFHNVNPDAAIECIATCAGPDKPPKYPVITAGEHLAQKHAAATGGH
ncbi:MAG: isopenicillin N synthase family oxygenase [Candidatus Latescibacteria bacterium]|nr:isopenicillin N synthase family oxygenase [Candidatus Latescibacterota bacterium]